MDNFPSQSLINAAFTSLSSGTSAATTAVVAGVIAGAAIGEVFPFGLLITDVVQLYYSSLVLSVSATGKVLQDRSLKDCSRWIKILSPPNLIMILPTCLTSAKHMSEAINLMNDHADRIELF
jgi:hypothetical protein